MTLYMSVLWKKIYDLSKKKYEVFLELENKEDAALALIEIYEEYATHVSYSDSYILAKRAKSSCDDSQNYKWRIEDPEGYRLWSLPSKIESLLILPEYFSRLDEGLINRFLNAMSNIYDVLDSVTEEVFGYKWIPTFIINGGLEKIRLKKSIDCNLIPFYHAKDGNDYIIGNGIEYVDDGYIYTTDGLSVPVLKALSDFSSAVKIQKRNEYQLAFPNSTYYSSATAKYNCHSYAWYLNNSSNMKWLNGSQLIKYVNDNHCMIISPSNIHVGDIVVYSTDIGGGDPYAHSGIVISTNPLRIRSKMGSNCVWDHSLTDVSVLYKK